MSYARVHAKGVFIFIIHIVLFNTVVSFEREQGGHSHRLRS